MDKISGILPATARITTVDLRNSGIARSGTPGFGRDVGVSTVAAKNAALETSAKANLLHKDQIKIRNSESDPKSAIVQRMADSFFINNAKRRENEVEGDMRINMNSEEVEAKGVSESEADQDSAAAESSSSASESSDDNLSVGQYLDVQA